MVQGQDDYASIQEMLRRRFKRMSDEGYRDKSKTLAIHSGTDTNKDSAWALLPNLIIIDGGKGQLNAALEVLDEFELRDAIPIIGLAKREEEIFLPGHSESLMLPANSQGLYLIQRVRDEAHRFGVSYHRQLRGKSAVRSQLDEIEGIGSKRRRALLRKFGSLDGIRKASLDEIAAVPGMTKKAAQQVKDALEP
jgi:excinuclease ABC subunit C